ncbi:MAG TPA: hypothetical protein VJI32_06395 [Candidatus Nanoarchaeia archaeon]|nr:hypothetical protein [Candidatus Woesearchaeota archaeon]HIG92622.1 hypothetical protein [Candidatus Woesearchaeota archaeon]HIH12886.1 hypothetical protein [Candidatus Woesearchaeota archaeon]HLC71616.1 hypothetical protein [Candidatus Nanoarchaeia archaeon]
MHQVQPYLERVCLMKLAAPATVWKKLAADDLFLQWKKQHTKGFLSHFFCSLTADFAVKSNWEVGFYDPATEKITVFAWLDNGSFAVKAADDVFKKPDATVEELKMSTMTAEADKPFDTFTESVGSFFPGEVLGDGFLIVQNWQGATIWNFTFITKTLKFVNVKIDAGDGEVMSHEVIDLVMKDK